MQYKLLFNDIQLTKFCYVSVCAVKNILIYRVSRYKYYDYIQYLGVRYKYLFLYCKIEFFSLGPENNTNWDTLPYMSKITFSQGKYYAKYVFYEIAYIPPHCHQNTRAPRMGYRAITCMSKLIGISFQIP